MIILRVGDPHVQIKNLDESEKLIDFIAKTALEYKVDRIEILGDLFHNHAVLRLEILEFWTQELEHLSDICEVIVLVGNHDRSGDNNSDSSVLDIFMKFKKKNLKIVNLPRLEGIYGYVPYLHDKTRFVEACNTLHSNGAKVLICHATFDGATFESGFYAPEGIDQKLIPFDTIISGHIHAQQTVGKVIYAGTPRWDTSSDANQPKGIWVYEHDDSSGAIKSQKFITTEHVCQPIYSFTYRETDPTVPSWLPTARVALELVGSSDWVSKQKELFKGKCSISTKITDKAKLESRKIGAGFEQFITNYVTKVDKAELLSYMRELELV